MIRARWICHLLLLLSSGMVIDTLSTKSIVAKLPFDPYIAANAEDASLNAIYAATPDHVWTVGDRGIIWATDNGGRNWKKQDSGTTANLHAVVFRDASEGCAIGGLVGAHTRLSRGVVLRTKNGGEKWEEVQTDSLPRLTGMRLVGSRIIAWGDYCPQRKSGIFTSHDYGMTWQALPCSIVHVAALGSDASGNLLAVDRVGNLFNSKLGPLRSTYMTRPDQAIEFVEHLGSVWLAGGTDGQLMRSVDGESWSRIKLPLSAAAQKACHWRSAFRWEDHLWIVGTPGSVVAYSPNRGVTWEILATDQRLPLRAQCFADAQRGWSVGTLGQILATRDGGKTWYVQRSTAARGGLMTVVAHEQQVPWPALVSASWDEMVPSCSVSLFAKHLEQSADYLVEDWKFHECIAPQMGIADHRGWLKNTPNAAINSSDMASLSDRLTVELLSWRPDVLLTSETADCAAADNRTAMAIVAAAMQQAADPTSQSFARELHLSPWQITKLATVTDARASHFTEQPNRLMRETGLTIWDAMSPMAIPYSAMAPSLPMRTLQQVQSTQANNSSLFGGIAPSKDSKRQVQARSLGNYQLIMGRVHRMTSIDGLATMAPETSLAEWQNQFDFVIRTLPPRELVTSIHRILQGNAAPVHWPRRKIALQRLIQLQPESDAASAARIQLMQLASSDELLAWQQSTATAQATALVSNTSNDSANISFVGNPSAKTPFDVRPASAQTPISSTASSDLVTTANAETPLSTRSIAPRHKSVEEFFQLLDEAYKQDPFLIKLPQLEMQLAAAQRVRGEADKSIHPGSAGYEEIVKLASLAGWPQAAQQEMLLALGAPERLRWIGFAVQSNQRPKLDGLLDEPMWQVCPPMILQTAGGVGTTSTKSRASLRWSYDDRYLYIAVECPRSPNSTPASPPKLRKYDSDLAAMDHIQITLDSDRDYASAITFGIAATGETYDRCCDMVSYNPKYAVAVPSSPLADRWTAELAIRLEDLTTHQQLTGRAWAVTAHRHNVNGEHASWSSMVTEQACLQSAGLLLFVPPPSN